MIEFFVKYVGASWITIIAVSIVLYKSGEDVDDVIKCARLSAVIAAVVFVALVTIARVLGWY